MNWEQRTVLIPNDFGDDTSRWAVIMPSDPLCEETVYAWYVVDETGESPVLVASGSDPTLEAAKENAEAAFKHGGCAACGSRDVRYENPRTGAGCYVCQDCEHMQTKLPGETRAGEE